MLGKLFCLLLLIGIGYGFYDAYVLMPERPVSGKVLKEDMETALHYRAFGMNAPYTFILGAMKDDICFSNAEQQEFDVICQDWQTKGMFMQLLMGGIEKPTEKASAEKPDLEI